MKRLLLSTGSAAADIELATAIKVLRTSSCVSGDAAFSVHANLIAVTTAKTAVIDIVQEISADTVATRSRTAGIKRAFAVPVQGIAPATVAGVYLALIGMGSAILHVAAVQARCWRDAGDTAGPNVATDTVAEPTSRTDTTFALASGGITDFVRCADHVEAEIRRGCCGGGRRCHTPSLTITYRIAYAGRHRPADALVADPDEAIIRNRQRSTTDSAVAAIGGIGVGIDTGSAAAGFVWFLAVWERRTAERCRDANAVAAFLGSVVTAVFATSEGVYRTAEGVARLVASAARAAFTTTAVVGVSTTGVVPVAPAGEGAIWAANVDFRGTVTLTGVAANTIAAFLGGVVTASVRRI